MRFSFGPIPPKDRPRPYLIRSAAPKRKPVTARFENALTTLRIVRVSARVSGSGGDAHKHRNRDDGHDNSEVTLTDLGNEFAETDMQDLYDSEDPLVPGRTCGTCMLCCKVLAIDELHKPAGVMCRHAVAGKGCTIREQRPRECHQFFCGWRLDPNIDGLWKPEVCGFVLSISFQYGAMMLNTDPDRPQAWKVEPYYSRLRDWARRAFLENKRIVAMVTGHATVILPDRDVPIGALAPEDEIVLSRQGGSYHAERRRRPAAAG
jgi:hypothetical protein